MKKGILLLGILALGFSSCKKEENNGNTKPKTNSEKIVGKWKGDVIETKITIPPAPTQTDTESVSYMNIKFKSNGTVVTDSLGFDPETDHWSLIGDNKIVLDEDTFDIYTLTDTKFNLGRTEEIDFGGATGSFNVTIKLKK